MKTFVIGDIHGAHKALVQCLKISGFDYAQDHLIALGDVCDGYPQVDQCIEELLKIKHCYYIIGNHDLWALDWALEKKEEEIWTSQGGMATILSYGSEPMPVKHVYFLKKARGYYEVDGKIFVHGGFDPNVPIEKQGKSKFVWDRELIYAAKKKSLENKDYKFGVYDEIFLGHTPTKNFEGTLPLHMCNVWAIDTGAGWGGPLTIMDINTKQYWQSEPTEQLYPGLRGR